MNGFVSLTDMDWYRALRALGSPDEVNFWRHGRTPFRALRPGEPVLFKLRQRDGGAIVGFGFFVQFAFLSVFDAWAWFGPRNGVTSLQDLRQRLARHARSGALAALDRPVGCIMLAAPVLFPEGAWVAPPSDWKRQIVTGCGYDLTAGEGARVWRECLHQAHAQALSRPVAETLATVAAADSPPRHGAPRLVRPRLGQGTFRAAVRAAYGRCAISGTRALPTLDAAHIRPYADAGPHAVSNGVLLRADLHRLFDRGYLSITPDLRITVSDALRETFGDFVENPASRAVADDTTDSLTTFDAYTTLHGQTIHTPEVTEDAPDRDFLAYHHEHVFLR